MGKFLHSTNLIRYFIELSLEATLSIVIDLYMDDLDTVGDIITLIIAIAFAIVNLVIAFGLPFYLCRVL